MGVLNPTPKRKDEKIFLSCLRLSYLSPKGVNQPRPDPTVPRAYLKYIHYDQDSQFVSLGYMPISDEANFSKVEKRSGKFRRILNHFIFGPK